MDAFVDTMVYLSTGWHSKIEDHKSWAAVGRLRPLRSKRPFEFWGTLFWRSYEKRSVSDIPISELPPDFVAWASKKFTYGSNSSRPFLAFGEHLGSKRIISSC